MPRKQGFKIEITLYPPDGEEAGEVFSQAHIPWKVLKRAAKLFKAMGSPNDPEKVSMDFLEGDSFDELSEFIVSFFGNQFSVERLENEADAREVMTVLVSIVSQFGEISANPTLPG